MKNICSKKLYFLLIVVTITLLSSKSFAQVAVSPDTSLPDPSAMLDVKSSNKGVLVPRVTSAQRTSIVKPANGLIVYDTDTNNFWYYKSATGWTKINSENYWVKDLNGINYTGGTIGVGTASNAITPIKVLQANSGTGGAVFEGLSDDVWHTAMTMQNNPINVRYTFVIPGPTNTNLSPGSFGLFNHDNLRWIFVSNRYTNNLGIGVPSINAQVPKSTLHVFTGDINVEQIGNGIIMKSPNGQCWRVTVGNDGSFVSTAITCP